MKPIQLIIFDFGDVIGHFDTNHFNEFIEKNGGNSKKVASYFLKNKSLFDIGNITLAKNFGFQIIHYTGFTSLKNKLQQISIN